MSRIKILASTIPLLLVALLGRGELAPASTPCISNGHVALQIAAAPWQAQTKVSFTNDAARATVRVQIVDAAETADFAVTDDGAATEPGAPVCGGAAPRFVGISDTAAPDDPVIYLSGNGDADYRVYVDSRTFTPREAAALIVSAGQPRITAAALSPALSPH
jgi:hypothetical protein